MFSGVSARLLESISTDFDEIFPRVGPGRGPSTKWLDSCGDPISTSPIFVSIFTPVIHFEWVGNSSKVVAL